MQFGKRKGRFIEPRPLLRLYKASEEDDQCGQSCGQTEIVEGESLMIGSMRWAFLKLRWPELRSKKSASDGPRWLRYWELFEAEYIGQMAADEWNAAHPDEYPPMEREQRITNPLSLAEVNSGTLGAFQSWLQQESRFPLPAGASSVNKAMKEVRKWLELAADEGHEVQRVKVPKSLRVRARPRYYLDGESIDSLWRAAERMVWPPMKRRATMAAPWTGTGMETSEWWRCVLVLLRNYGMRVQDLVAYDHLKAPITWRDVSLEEQSPNPESLERWPLGWLYYRASKTEDSSGREYYLPLTVSARAAVDRLKQAALSLDGQARADSPIVRVAMGHGLTEHFKTLQGIAGVATRTGQPYQLEDLRKTVATYSATVHAELPWALCGWTGSGGGSQVARKHYQQPEPLLVRELHRVPMPACFSEWDQPTYRRLVAGHIRELTS